MVKKKISHSRISRNSLLSIPKIGKIKLKKGSIIYVATDHAEYHNVQGKSLTQLWLDEFKDPIGDMQKRLKRAKRYVHQDLYRLSLYEIEEALKLFEILKEYLGDNEK